jgi:signal transduction histidine kinase/CheY-like chemotaxis protein
VEVSERPKRTPSSPEGALRFHLAVQKSRLGVIALMLALAGVARAAGLVDFPVVPAVVGFSFGIASVFVFMALHRAAARRGSSAPIHYGWMALDTALICWSIYLTRDSSPLWLVWFLTTATAAAFVAGRRAAQAVIAGSSLGYLALLVAMGRIQGLDHELTVAVGRLALLFGGTWFMVRGIADLREKRLEIAALVEEKSARLAELQDLTAELDRRGRELAEANRGILEANRAKSQFLANMSHELRTPLNSIIGFSEILADKLAGAIEPRFERFLHNILNSGRHLLSLINDILDLSKIEAGRMELVFEPVSLADVVHGVESVMHGVAARRSIRLEVEIAPGLPPVVADSPRVKQVLYNLVSNAVKFSHDGGTVTLRARSLADAPSPLDLPAVVLEVEDRGIGIRREDQQLIFEEFRQVDGGTTRNMGGTGLGLALVKRFVAMHGGRIEVESEPGRGSLFRVFLPVDASRSPHRRPAGEPVSFGFTVAEAKAAIAAPGATVLVAEDDEEFFRALAGDLEAAGYQVLRARDGDEALALARGGSPAAITLDLVLPGRDGWEVLKELKADPATAAIPVIIVSLISNHELGFALGASDYFVKPLDRALFLGRLREIAAPETGGRRPLVLVVDDDPQVHDFLELELAEGGYEMLSAGSGAEGVALALERRPAVIVLDLLMEGVDGFQAASELQRRPETARIPILVFTSKELGPEDRRRLAGRVAALLSKAPEDRRRVVATIRAIEHRQVAAEGAR